MVNQEKILEELSLKFWSLPFPTMALSDDAAAGLVLAERVSGKVELHYMRSEDFDRLQAMRDALRMQRLERQCGATNVEASGRGAKRPRSAEQSAEVATWQVFEHEVELARREQPPVREDDERAA